MSSSLLITLEMAGVLGVVLLLGGWELWSLRRDKARDKAQDKADPAAPPADRPGDRSSSPDSIQRKQPPETR